MPRRSYAIQRGTWTPRSRTMQRLTQAKLRLLSMVRNRASIGCAKQTLRPHIRFRTRMQTELGGEFRKLGLILLRLWATQRQKILSPKSQWELSAVLARQRTARIYVC